MFHFSILPPRDKTQEKRQAMTQFKVGDRVRIKGDAKNSFNNKYVLWHGIIIDYADDVFGVYFESTLETIYFNQCYLEKFPDQKELKNSVELQMEINRLNGENKFLNQQLLEHANDLRDRFAMACVGAIYTSDATHYFQTHNSAGIIHSEIAKEAYALADSLIKAREAK